MKFDATEPIAAAVADAVRVANAMNALPVYPYLGDVTDSPTGDKKAEAFEDSYLDELVPELKRIGWGQVLPIAVIDVQSFVTPPESPWVVVWPAADSKDVPTDFANGAKELPNPVPSEPEQDFGYPVTLQLGQTDPKQPSPEIAGPGSGPLASE